MSITEKEFLKENPQVYERVEVGVAGKHREPLSILNQTYDVCVVGGLGHVGLPLGICLAEAGKRVVLYDINQEAAQTVSQGLMPFLEAEVQTFLGRSWPKSDCASPPTGRSSARAISSSS